VSDGVPALQSSLEGSAGLFMQRTAKQVGRPFGSGAAMTAIDFQGIKAAALRNARSLLPRLIPGGKFRSREYIVLNPRRADRSPGSFKVNYKTGEWCDFALEGAKGGDLISLTAYVRDTSQGDAARELADMVGVLASRVSGTGHNGNGWGDGRAYDLVTPVPVNAPLPPTTHPTLGNPSHKWTYEDAAGARSATYFGSILLTARRHFAH
jgi:putative DNA primase/helicase